MFNEMYFWMLTYLGKIKTNKTPAFNAYLIISALQIFNIGTVYVIGNYFLKIVMDRNSAIILGLIFAAAFAILNYFILYAKRESIIKKYSEAPIKRKIRGQILFWLYTILSFVVYFVSIANLVTPRY